MLVYHVVAAQQVSPRFMCHLSDTVHETSGLIAVSPSRIYTHNDSGDLPRIFEADTTGAILRTIYLSQANAIDYEDITRDDQGNFYIGDFGNNFNNRTDLTIYKIPDPDLNPGDSITASAIHFTYPDQTAFPPVMAEQNFDCEGIIFYRDSLYLFSKNRGTSHYSRMYRLPASPGTYTALLVDSFYTYNWVTSAAINPSGNTVVLLSEAQLFIITGLHNGNFSGADTLRLTMPLTQKEGVSFLNDSVVYITDEQYGITGGNLYELNIGSWLKVNNPLSEFSYQLSPNPSDGELTFSFYNDGLCWIEIIDASGRLVYQKSEITSGTHFSLPLASGMYIARITHNGNEFTPRKLIIQRN